MFYYNLLVKSASVVEFVNTKLLSKLATIREL